MGEGHIPATVVHWPTRTVAEAIDEGLVRALARFSLFEEFHLAWRSLAGPPQPGQSDVAKHPLDGPDGDPHLVDAAQPELRPLGAVLELPARLPDKLDDPRGDTSTAAPGVPRHQPLESILPPAHARTPNRPHADAEAASCRGRTMHSREMQHHQPLPDPQPILQSHLHVAQLDDHDGLPWGSSAAPQSRKGQS